MAAVYVLAAQNMRPLTKSPLLWGFLYGLVLYVAMNYIVSPLSAAGAAGHFPADIAEAAGRLQTSTLRRRVNQRDWAAAGTELRRWIYGGGKALPGLVARREAEAAWLVRNI